MRAHRPSFMPSLLRAFAAASALACVASSGLAAEAADAGRFSMTPAANGFLRLDKQTGAVSLCVAKGDGAECRAAADDRAALNDEIDRLTKKIAELEARAPAATSGALPNRQEMGRVMDLAEDFMRRMMRIMREDDQPGRDHI